MSIFMTFRIALKALNRNKMRTALTMLGMIIGVGAVITMVALGNGASAMIESQIQSVGTNIITVNAGSFSMGGAHMGGGSSNRLTAEDAEAIRNEVPGARYVVPGFQTRAQVIVGNMNWFTRIQGTDVDLPMIRSWKMEYGTFFSAQDVTTAAKVCVLGKVVRDQLFGEGEDPTGQIIRIKNQPFKVIGVLESKGQAAMGQDQDDSVYAPYTTVTKKLQRVQYINEITVSAATADSVQKVANDIAELMRVRHKIMPGEEDDFMVRTLEEMAALRTQATQTMTYLLAGIAGVSLLVGGIGIMNIMLVSVTERTREIGLRMSLGARGWDVLTQFLVEAIVLSMLGGTVGILFGFGISQGLTQFMQWPTAISTDAVAVAFGFAALIGIFFGFYPARKASALDPIEALRYE
ncbi:MAG: ABC transporter permease [Vicinamibacterales bacterium]